MTRTVLVLWLSTSVVVPGTLGQVAAAANQQIKPGSFFKSNDTQLRGLAITAPPPVYPRTSLAKSVAGVVIANVRFDATGATEGFDIIQSPDADTGRAVREAVMQWKIKPMMSAPMRGILVFYFQMKGRDGVVLSPAEMREVISPGAKNVKREDEPPVKHITEADFRALSPRSNPLLVDIRDWETFGEGHEKGAVNIPFDELLTRGPAELPVSRHIVIDCRDPLELCAMGVHWLASSGFSQVSILRR